MREMFSLEWVRGGDAFPSPGIAVTWIDNGALFTSGEVALRWVTVEDMAIGENNLLISGDLQMDRAKRVLAGNRYEGVSKGVLDQGSMRLVYPILNTPVLPFRFGLTIHAMMGTWSSLPHFFERTDILEPRVMPFFELFAYVTRKPGGWADQHRIGHLFPLDGRGQSPYIHKLTESYWINDVVTVRDRDILEICDGSHPVSAGPGVQLGYFWLYWGDIMEQREKFRE